MEYEVPSIVETQLTGRLGQANRKVRGVDYSVVFVLQAGEIAASPWRNGMAIDWTPLTRKMAESGRKFFAAEPLNSRGDISSARIVIPLASVAALRDALSAILAEPATIAAIGVAA